MAQPSSSASLRPAMFLAGGASVVLWSMSIFVPMISTVATIASYSSISPWADPVGFQAAVLVGAVALFYALSVQSLLNQAMGGRS